MLVADEVIEQASDVRYLSKRTSSARRAVSDSRFARCGGQLAGRGESHRFISSATLACVLSRFVWQAHFSNVLNKIPENISVEGLS